MNEITCDLICSQTFARVRQPGLRYATVVSRTGTARW
jgi:hypothetical protein